MKNEKKIARLVPATAANRRPPTANCSTVLRVTLWLILSLSLPLLSQSKASKFPMQKKLAKQSDKPIRATLNTNEWSYWVLWDGQSGRNPRTGDAGGLYPQKSVSGVFADGLLWAGIVDDPNSDMPLRANGSTYISGSLPGRILPSGEAQSPDDSDVRLWRIRSDFETASDGELLEDAAETFDLPIGQVTASDIQVLREQYRYDWENWPAQWGAPYVDINNNGSWDRGLDMPGVVGFSQMIWIVTNDLDLPTSVDFLGSLPMGLEIQSAFWTMKNPIYNDFVFRQSCLTNRSQFNIRDMYIGMWADTDLGDFGDDLTGSDSLLGLGYTWNGLDEDGRFAAKNLPPGAVGYLLLQGPIVAAPGEVAWFNNEQLEGYINLPAGSFIWFGGFIWWKPPSGYSLTLAWYNSLRGYTPTFDTENPTPYTVGSGPNQGFPTKWPHSGDPVNDPLGLLGDVDGNGDNVPPGDRRYALSSGPFSLGPGETQEVTFALIGGIDPAGDRYDAISKLKRRAETAKAQYPHLDNVPEAKLDITYTSNDNTVYVTVDLKDRQFDRAEVVFRDSRGIDDDFTNPLRDDGILGDSIANDNIMVAGPITFLNRPYPYIMDVVIHQFQSAEIIPEVLRNVRLRPEPSIVDVQVDWENGRQDRIVNHGETVHLTYKLSAEDERNTIEQLFVNNVEINDLSFEGQILANSPQFRFIATAPFVGEKLKVPYEINYDGFRMTSTLEIPIKIWKPTALWQDTLDVVRISAVSANLIPLVSDASLVTGDQYQIEFFDNPADSQTIWQLTNITTGELLLENEPIAPDANHPFPVVDGIQFQVAGPPPGVKHFQTVANAAGPIEPPIQGAFAFNSNGFPTHDGMPLTPGVNDRPDAFRQQTNGSTWGIHTGGTGRSLYETFLARVFRNDNIDRAIRFDFELRFTEEVGYAIWAFETGGMGEVPFELWNTGIGTPDDPSDDYRMIPWVLNDADFGTGAEVFNINALDHAVSGSNNDPYTDWIYWRDPDDKTPGDAGYQAFVEDGLAGTYDFGGAEVMARTVLVNWNGGVVDDPGFPANVDALMPETGTVFRIIMQKSNLPGDKLLVDTAPVYQPELFYPVSFFLDQNYPNPFNPETTIEFALPEAVDVKLEVFNVLGQRIKTLMDERLEPAEYRVIWDGSDRNGSRVASGIYFYRISAGRFVKTRKMILLH